MMELGLLVRDRGREVGGPASRVGCWSAISSATTGESMEAVGRACCVYLGCRGSEEAGGVM